MAQQVLTITQINEYIRCMMDGDRLLMNVAIKGEISNYKVYPSGHHYFTLKDDGSTLKCVLFKGNATKLRFRPENGMQVIAMGRITVYPRDGAYQMYCTAMAMDGIGDLYALFEQLKNKLAAKGLFDPAHKKPLPQYPNRIGIITSSAGSTFSLTPEAQNEKRLASSPQIATRVWLAKENAAKKISPSAEGAKGYSPLTSQAFEKA